jgi:hypothetical protein
MIFEKRNNCPFETVETCTSTLIGYVQLTFVPLCFVFLSHCFCVARNVSIFRTICIKTEPLRSLGECFNVDRVCVRIDSNTLLDVDQW